jgi:hypothetical protein
MLGRDSFRELMQCGVSYDKKFGFKLSSDTDLERFKEIIFTAVGDEVEISRSCYICQKLLSESSPGSTFCDQCRDTPDIYFIYSERFDSQMQNL